MVEIIRDEVLRTSDDGNGVCLLVEETEDRPSVPVPAKCCRLPKSPTRECCQPEFEQIHHKKHLEFPVFITTLSKDYITKERVKEPCQLRGFSPRPF